MLKKALKEKIPYYVWYTVLFLLISFVIIGIYIRAGKSFVWAKDGIAQHYPVLIYIHKYLTGIITNLMNGKFSAPMVDYRIGQGMDVLTTLNYYGFGDPLMLLSVLCPTKYMEIMYGIIIFIRLYLSGVFFSVFCCIKKQGRDSTVLTGALLYVFSGYGLYASVRHPFFVDGMIFLPLILIGVERILQKRKYGFFAVVIGWSMLTNFYFTYMNTVMMAIYILFRLVPISSITWKQKIRYIIRMMGGYLCGILMAGIVAVPVIMAYLGCSRGGEGGYNGSLLHYDKDFYLAFIGAYFFPGTSIGEWTNLSFTIVAFVALCILFVRRSKRRAERKRNWSLRIGYILFTAMMLFPLAGKVMNGFGYVSNRWNYAYAMLIAYIVVCMLPHIIDLIAFWLYKIKGVSTNVKIRRTVERSVCILMVVILMLQAQILYMQNGYLSEFVDSGKANDVLADSAVQTVSDTETDDDTTSFGRTEQAWHIGNQSIALNYFGHSWYFSIAPKSFCKHYNGFELNGMERTYSLRGLDSRAMLNELTSTKYYVTDCMTDGLIPYGYYYAGSEERTDGLNAYLYKNRYYLPIGYTVENYISKEDYEKLSPIERQEALMQSVMLDTDDADKVNEKQIKSSDLSLLSSESDCTVTSMDGMTWAKGKLTVAKDNATMTVSFKGVENSETYLHLNGIDVYRNGKQYQTCEVTSDNSHNYFVLMNPAKTSWYENNDLTVNMGYSRDARTECTITIPYKGIYYLDSMSVISQPMDNYAEQVDKLSEDTLQNLTMQANYISGNITLDHAKLMQFTIPYSSGWKAYIDGEQQSILQSNDMYMSLDVPAGKHTIELRYSTAGLKAGCGASAAGFVVFAGVLFHQRRRRLRQSTRK